MRDLIVEASENIWIAPVIALAIGIILGVVLTQIARRVSSGSSASTQAQLESLQLRFEEYQQEVASHFKTTAGLVSRLNRDYQDIQQHMTQGAVDLAPDEMTRERLLASLHQDTPLVASKPRGSDPEVFDSLEPPRDYAPKTEGPGTLSEDFNLSKKA